MKQDLNYINWPEDLNPENSPVYTHNELEMNVSPKKVWAWLIRAVKWPEWYLNSKDVRIIQGKSKIDLSLGCAFTWKTFGMRVKTKVEVFKPFQELAWRGTGFLGEGYHAWLIEKTPKGCRVITEEVQRGFLISMGRWYIRKLLLSKHQIWLEELKNVSQRSLGW